MICKCGHPDNNHFVWMLRPCAHCPEGFCTKFDPVQTPTELKLRALRLWHWRQALVWAKTQRSKLSSKSSRTKARNLWNLHMDAVQLLNDFVSGTAEQDATEQEKSSE